MGVVTTAWGIGGDLGIGRIHSILVEKHDIGIWTLLFVGPGLVMFWAAVREYLHGRSWNVRQLHQSASIRSVSHFMSFFSWIYVLKLLFELEMVRATLSLTLMSAPLAAISAWFYYETLRVRYALDHRHHTPNLVVRR